MAIYEDTGSKYDSQMSLICTKLSVQTNTPLVYKIIHMLIEECLSLNTVGH